MSALSLREDMECRVKGIRGISNEINFQGQYFLMNSNPS